MKRKMVVVYYNLKVRGDLRGRLQGGVLSGGVKSNK